MESSRPFMEWSPINRLPPDSLHQIFSSLPLRQIMICGSVYKFFNHLLTSECFTAMISNRPPLNLLPLRPPHHHHRHRTQSIANITPSPLSVASLSGLIYLWGDSLDSSESSKSLVACTPLSSRFFHNLAPPGRITAR
ncbi:unnamed protein product [Cochlearia groenlandica]